MECNHSLISKYYNGNIIFCDICNKNISDEIYIKEEIKQ